MFQIELFSDLEYRLCPHCHRYSLSTNFTKNFSWCRGCWNTYQNSRLTKDPRVRMLTSSLGSAGLKDLEHDIRLSDIPLPTHCKYLGYEITYETRAIRGEYRPRTNPSIDRIDSTKGYVVGNIQVISDLANRMKQDATVEELIAFAQGVLKAHAPHLLKD